MPDDDWEDDDDVFEEWLELEREQMLQEMNALNIANERLECVTGEKLAEFAHRLGITSRVGFRCVILLAGIIEGQLKASSKGDGMTPEEIVQIGTDMIREVWQRELTAASSASKLKHPGSETIQ